MISIGIKAVWNNSCRNTREASITISSKSKKHNLHESDKYSARLNLTLLDMLHIRKVHVTVLMKVVSLVSPLVLAWYWNRRCLHIYMLSFKRTRVHNSSTFVF